MYESSWGDPVWLTEGKNPRTNFFFSAFCRTSFFSTAFWGMFCWLLLGACSASTVWHERSRTRLLVCHEWETAQTSFLRRWKYGWPVVYCGKQIQASRHSNQLMFFLFCCWNNSWHTQTRKSSTEEKHMEGHGHASKTHKKVNSRRKSLFNHMPVSNKI